MMLFVFEEYKKFTAFSNQYTVVTLGQLIHHIVIQDYGNSFNLI